MPWFKVQVRGENLRMNMDGKLRTLGFFTTRLVEAQSSASAEEAAIQVIQDDPDLCNRILNDEADSPMLFVERIEPLPATPNPTVLRGFTFFGATGR